MGGIVRAVDDYVIFAGSACRRLGEAIAAQLGTRVGKSEVNLHGSHWLVGAMMERPLAELRAELSALGLGRRAGVTMLEDHLSALFETMRLLITGSDARAPVPVATQRAFFERHIGAWAFACCAAIRETTIANYYACVAEFTEQFMALDRDALAMD